MPWRTLSSELLWSVDRLCLCFEGPHCVHIPRKWRQQVLWKQVISHQTTRLDNLGDSVLQSGGCLLLAEEMVTSWEGLCLCCSPAFFYYYQVSFKLSFNSAKKVFLGHQQCACVFCVHNFRALLCSHHQMSCMMWLHVVYIHYTMLSEFFVLFPNCACECNICQSHSSHQLLMFEAETAGYE